MSIRLETVRHIRKLPRLWDAHTAVRLQTHVDPIYVTFSYHEKQKESMKNTRNAMKASIATALLASLAACGGGGGDGGVGFPISAPTPAPSPAPEPAPSPAPAPAPAEDDSGVAASCASLTSGTYRYLTSSDKTDLTGLLQIKAGLLGTDGTRTTQITDASGAHTTLAPVANNACEFTLDGNKVVIGPKGLGLSTDPVSGGYAITLLFPEQTGDSAVKVSDLNGEFNILGWVRPNDTDNFSLNYGAYSFADGAIGSVSACPDTPNIIAGCTSVPLPSASPATGFAADAANNGFAGTGDLSSFHAYAFKVDDALTLIAYNKNNGSVAFLTNQRLSTLPTAGDVNHYWQFTANTLGESQTDLAADYNTVVTVDSGASVVTRYTGTNSGVEQTVRYNAPLPGFRKRDGVANSISPAIQLPLGGGLTAVSRLGANSANGFLNLSLSKPAPAAPPAPSVN